MIGPGAENRREFYQAFETGFGAVGEWECDVRLNSATCVDSIAEVKFCGPISRSELYVGGRLSPVELVFDGRNLTAGQPSTCPRATLSSVLGQNGEDDVSPQQGVDTYSFEGKPGEKVEVRLGSGGSGAEVATLRVRAANGALLGQRRGAVPLVLAVTLPGTVEIAVSRSSGSGEPFRGGYELEVAAQSGDIGPRKLRPSTDVEE